MTGTLAWQGSLFGPDGEDLSFSDATRRVLDPASWVDEVPGWLHGHDALFAERALATRAADPM